MATFSNSPAQIGDIVCCPFRDVQSPFVGYITDIIETKYFNKGFMILWVGQNKRTNKQFCSFEQFRNTVEAKRWIHCRCRKQ